MDGLSELAEKEIEIAEEYGGGSVGDEAIVEECVKLVEDRLEFEGVLDGDRDDTVDVDILTGVIDEMELDGVGLEDTDGVDTLIGVTVETELDGV